MRRARPPLADTGCPCDRASRAVFGSRVRWLHCVRSVSGGLRVNEGQNVRDSTEWFVRFVQHVRLEVTNEVLVVDRGVDLGDGARVEGLGKRREPSTRSCTLSIPISVGRGVRVWRDSDRRSRGARVGPPIRARRSCFRNRDATCWWRVRLVESRRVRFRSCQRSCSGT